MNANKQRIWISMALCSVVSFAWIGTASAEVDIDLRGGYYFDIEDPFLGGGVLIDLGDSGHWYLNPNLEYVFVDDGDLFTLNGDAHFDFDTKGDYFFWLGAGPALIRTDFDVPGGDSETDLGANLFAGIAWKREGVRPFAQAKVVVADESDFVLGIGIRF